MTVPAITLTEPVGVGDAPLIVLGSSLGTATVLWEKVVPVLARQFRVTAWDLPGHGASPVAREPLMVEELADAVADAADALTAGKSFSYAGVSLGGAVGLALALRYPSLVNRAAIVASGAQLGDPGTWHRRAAQVRAQSTSSLLVGSAQRWFTPGSVQREPDLAGRLLHALQNADDESYARCCEALAAYDVRDSLGEVRMPVLALWGEHDAVAPEAKSLEIARGVRGGRSTKVADAAHLPPANQPAAVADLLLQFFEEETRWPAQST